MLKRNFLLVTLAVFASVGTAVNGIHLLRHFYLWPLVRSIGYGSLGVYSLLMLGQKGYNTPPDEDRIPHD